MKIKNLILKNFGPFVGENAVDFSKLEDIFLIYGNTGSGKTTIFDAVSFALYGKLPGAREKQDIRKCRSDFALSEEDAFIELTFQVRDELYRVKRTLPFEYLTRNNTKREKDPTILFEKQTNEKKWIILNDTIKEANNAIEQSIGLTVTEFNTIILLPQGEFAQFLKQNSQQRRESLSTLFPVELYKTFMNSTKLKADSFAQEYKIIEKNLLQLQQDFFFDETERTQSQLGKEIIEKKERKSLVSEALNKKRETKTRLEQVLRLSQKLSREKEENETQKTQYDLLIKDADEIHLFEKKVKRLDYALKDLSETEEQIKKRENAIIRFEGFEKAKRIIENKLSELKKSKTLYEEKLKVLLDNKDALIDLIEEKNKTEKTLYEKKEKIVEIKKRIGFETELLQLEDREKHIDTEKKALSKTIENAKIVLDELIAEDEKNKIGYEAAIIAKSLEEGKACPVCGSLEHPQKAQEVTSLLSFEEKIESQKMLISESEKNLQKLENDSVRIQTELVNCKKNLFEIKSKDDLEIVEAELSEIEKMYFALSKKIEIKQNEEKEKERLNQEIKNFQNTIEKTENENDALQIDIALVKQEIGTLEKTILQSLGNYKDLVPEIENKKNENEKTSIDSFSSQTIETLKDEFDYLTKKIADYKKDTLETEKKLHTLGEQISDTEISLQEMLKLIPELQNKENDTEIFIQEDETISKDIAEKIGEIQNLEDEIEKLQAELKIEEEKAKQYDKWSKDLAKLQVKAEHINNLNALIIGKNEKKTPLDAWVLSLFLEDIIVHATQRLERLSSGRFSFSLKTENEGGKGYKGLEIEIFDSFTGKTRPPSTLSGGETFTASISLALALTDVVQSRSGGICIDSLFIDEGFGSLDPENLEIALSVIDEIREERVVGLISHVGDLSSRINSQIIVDKTNKGSKLSIL